MTPSVLRGLKRLSTEACSVNVAVYAYLAELLRVLASVRARRIHKCDDGEAKVVRMLHEGQRLAVAVRLRHPKVPEDVLLHVRHSVSRLPRPFPRCSHLRVRITRPSAWQLICTGV